jgi:hypothetical protein
MKISIKCIVFSAFSLALAACNANGQASSAIDSGTIADGARADGVTTDARVDGRVADGPGADASVAVQDFCPGTATFKVFDAADSFHKFSTGNYGDRPPNEFSAMYDLYAGDNFVVQVTVRDETSTATGRFPAGFEFIDIGATRAGKLVTISRSRCDYRATANWVSPAPVGNNPPMPSNGGSAVFAINEAGRPDAQFNLTTGTWYLNVQIAFNQCPAATPCNVIEQWAN